MSIRPPFFQADAARRSARTKDRVAPETLRPENSDRRSLDLYARRMNTGRVRAGCRPPCMR